MPQEETTLRLNKEIALRLGTSRRQGDDLIAAGKVKVNGTIAVLGQRIQPTDDISIDNKKIGSRQTFQYIALHKPVGYICSRRKQGEIETIYSLLPNNIHHLKPVGRLDKESSGLLLLTNDGDFAHKMTHPSFHKTKTYEIALDKDLEPLHHQMINDHGIDLEDGNSKLQLEKITDGDQKQWRVMMHEGRNRQIRRTFEALGYRITKLHRIQFGIFSLETLDIQSGKSKSIDVN